MSDFYELLGVEADAPVDDIRSAYRDKKAAAAAAKDPEQARTESAALNKAWNVLSDPYQRGRYDQQLADSGGADADGDDDGDDSAPVSRPRTTREAYKNEKNRTDKRGRPLPKPTITLPPGTKFPTTRERMTAMLADLAVLFAVFLIASLIVTPAVDKALHKPIVDKVDVLRKQADAATKKSAAADKAASAAKSNAASVAKAKGASSPEAQVANAAATKAQAAATAADKAAKDATTAFNNESKKLVPVSVAVGGIALLLCLFYLAIPSAKAGQTIGKRWQGICVMRVDGSPVGFAWSFRRYGLILFITFLLVFVTPFGALGAALVLFGVTTWTRNPNHQGLHDRLVKTIVVTDADET